MPAPTTVSDLFPREHLVAADLNGPVTATIAAVEIREFHVSAGQPAEAKLVIRFAKARRFLICNKTNALALMQITGTEIFADWVGASVQLVPTTYRGKPTIQLRPAPLPHTEDTAASK